MESPVAGRKKDSDGGREQAYCGEPEGLCQNLMFVGSMITTFRTAS